MSRSREEMSYTRLPVGRNCLSFFDNGDVTRDDLTCRDFLFCSPANDLARIDASIKKLCDHKGLGAYNGFHSDTCFELFDDVSRLFLLVPADKRIEHENSNLLLRVRRKEDRP